MSDKPYVPDTSTVRFAAAFPSAEFTIKGSDFDRWLEQVRAEAKQEGLIQGWRHGYIDGIHDERLCVTTYGGSIEPNRRNPYILPAPRSNHE